MAENPSVQRLIDAALKLADAHDETVDGEWGGGEGDTVTDEARAVRRAVSDLQGKER